jgi:hypothetical protein
MCVDAHDLLNDNSRTICFFTSGLGSVVMICSQMISRVSESIYAAVPYLQSKHSLATFEDTPGHGSSCALAQASQFNDPAFFACNFPTCIVQVFNIQGSSFFNAQFLQIRQQSLHTVVPLHACTTRMCRAAAVE